MWNEQSQFKNLVGFSPKIYLRHTVILCEQHVYLTHDSHKPRQQKHQSTDWKAICLALTLGVKWKALFPLFLASGKSEWQTYDGRSWVCVWVSVCVFSNSFQSLMILASFSEKMCYKESISLDSSTRLTKRLCMSLLRQKKRMTQHLACEERKTECNSRQTGNLRRRGRLIDNWQWLDWRHSRFPHLSNLKSPKLLFLPLPVNVCKNKSKKSSGRNRTAHRLFWEEKQPQNCKTQNCKIPLPRTTLSLSRCFYSTARTNTHSRPAQQCTKQDEWLSSLGNSFQGNQSRLHQHYYY